VLAFAYPGQGSQKVGMGSDFAEAFPVARQAYEEASDSLGFDMQTLCFEDEARLALTEFTQPAILATEVAMTRVLVGVYGVAPTAFAGHSLGEYSALVAAGALSFPDALRLVRERGRLMQNAVPVGVGAMTAVMCDAVDLDALVDATRDLDVDLANHNSSDQVVLSGRATDLALAEGRIAGDPRLQGAKLTRLAVSAPFHSRLMAPIEAPFRTILVGIDLAVERCPAVLSNFTGTWHTPATLADSLVRQISGPVRWVDDMQALAAIPRVVEVGPGRPLRAFFRSLDRTIDSVFNTLTAARLFGVHS
jgi:malonyl CoA-acyl carrier protein transacylase